MNCWVKAVVIGLLWPYRLEYFWNCNNGSEWTDTVTLYSVSRFLWGLVCADQNLLHIQQAVEKAKEEAHGNGDHALYKQARNTMMRASGAATMSNSKKLKSKFSARPYFSVRWQWILRETCPSPFLSQPSTEQCCVNYFKFLGTTISRDLRWTSHIDLIRKRRGEVLLSASALEISTCLGSSSSTSPSSSLFCAFPSLSDLHQSPRKTGTDCNGL